MCNCKNHHLVKCNTCNKEIYICKYRVKSFRFCSKNCHNKSMVGITPKHISNGWKASKQLRKQISKTLKKRFALNIADHPWWKGGKNISYDGYYLIYIKDHPLAPDKKIREHRLLMENYLKEKKPNSNYLIKINKQKYLNPKIIVHHKDGNKLNNIISNLECMTRSDHMKLHNQIRRCSISLAA